MIGRPVTFRSVIRRSVIRRPVAVRARAAIRPAVASLCLLWLLSGCSGTITYQSDTPDPAYDFLAIERAVRGGGIFADVVGNPFGDSSTAFRRRIRRMMGIDVAGVAMRFVGRAALARAGKYRVVVWFNPSQDPRRINLCTYLGGVAVHGNPDDLQVAMALCAGDRALTASSGIAYRLPGREKVRSADSPIFRDLIETVTANLFPQPVTDEEREYE